MSTAPSTVQRQLRPHPSSAGEARRLVRRFLGEAGRDDLIELAELLTSEVVTNALMHGGTAIDFGLAVVEDGLRVEVGDGSRHLPSRRAYAPTASTGRGLALVEQIADAWGVLPGIAGKTVWFQLTFGDDRLADSSAWATGLALAPPADGALTPAAADTVTVDLLNVPLLLLRAWYRHAEVMLRDHLLASLDLESDEEALSIHAAATDAAEIVAEQIPRAQTGGGPDVLLYSVAEPRVSLSLVRVRIPRVSVPHFATLNTALESALVMAEEGQLLSPCPQPELRSLRQWLCTQVDDQTHGGVPTPWSPEGQPPPTPPADPLVWDMAPVTEAAEAMIAADDTGQIVAVSDRALELLGYDDNGQMVGRRLVGIIPRRFRQAHLAGFTMHLLTGHGPLIDTPVLVPVQQRDGGEATVSLNIEAHRLPHGRTVFVATLEEPPSRP